MRSRFRNKFLLKQQKRNRQKRILQATHNKLTNYCVTLNKSAKQTLFGQNNTTD